MKKYFILGLLILLFAVGCGKKDPLVGTWEGKSDGEYGIGVTFVFDKNGDMSYKNEYGITGKGTYKVDDNKITLDMPDLWVKTYTFEIKDNKLSLDKIEHLDPVYKDLVKK